MAPNRPFPPLDPESLDEEQKALAAQLLASSNGYQGGPIPLLLRSPAMTSRLRPLIVYFARHTTLPRRLCELAILIQARHWEQDFEWWAHCDLAREAGLAEGTIADLAAGRRPAATRDDEAAVHDLCTELLIDHRARPETVAAARAFLDDRQIVDLVGVSGVYALLAMLLNLAGESAPVDAPRPDPGRE